MESPNVSIIVPCYNAARTIQRCLDSLLQQTAKSYEIICVNDGSQDETLDIIERNVANNPDRIRCITQHNQGLWHARWTGTDVAVGAYIAYVDSDDYVDATFVSSLYETAKNANADIAVCGFKRIDEQSGDVLSVEMDEARAPFDPQTDPGLLIAINSAAWNKMFRKDLLLSMNRLAHPPLILEDVALCELAYLAANGKIAFTGNAPYCYMIHSDSMINTITGPQIDSVRQALLEIRDCYYKDPRGKQLIESFETTVFLHMGVAIPFRVSANEQLSLSHELSLAKTYLDEQFPLWKTSKYLKLSYAHGHGGAFTKLFIASCFYKLHLMRPFLAAYRFMVERLHIEIKW